MKNRTKFIAAMSWALVGAITAFAQQQTLTGTLTDSMCGTSHMAKDKNPSKCQRDDVEE